MIMQQLEVNAVCDITVITFSLPPCERTAKPL